MLSRDAGIRVRLNGEEVLSRDGVFVIFDSVGLPTVTGSPEGHS